MTRDLDGTQLAVEAINLCGKRVLTKEAIDAIKKITPEKFAQANKKCRDGLEQILQEHAKSRDVGNRRTASELLQKLRTGDGGQQNGNVWTNGADESAQDRRLLTHTFVAPAPAAARTEAPAKDATAAPAKDTPVAPASLSAVPPEFKAGDQKLPNISTVEDAKRILAILELAIEEQSGVNVDMNMLTLLHAQKGAVGSRLAFLEKMAQKAKTQAFQESVKDTTMALVDTKAFDTFISQNFTKIEINGGLFSDGQVYYIANGAKNSQVAELLKKDDSPIRDVFIQKMASVKVKVSGKEYPAIATRDALLSNYKGVENKTTLDNAVAFDARQYDKTLSELKGVETSSDNTAKGLTEKFVSLLKTNPEQAKQFLRTAINGKNPTRNPALETFLADPVLNSQYTTIEPGKVQNTIKTILDGKSPAFVMNDTGIAFDGVSLEEEGAIVKGKIEGKDSREGFYQVKSIPVGEFIKDIPDADGTIKKMITAADGRGPIELGGKVFEVKGGKVLSLGKPDGSGFSLKDCLPNEYRTQDVARDAIILALAVKIWGLPSISMSLPSITVSVPGLSMSIPTLSTAASHILVGLGLGWFVARLVYGDDAQIGSNVQTLNKYQNAYNGLTGKTGKAKESVQNSNILEAYAHMTWDVEKDGTKIFRPLGKPQNIEGVDIMLLAIKPDGSINAEKTVVKKSSEKPVALSVLSNAYEIVSKIEA